MSHRIHRIALIALLAFSSGAAWAEATADKRPPGTDLKPGNHYCVKNAESGVCEDCWSGSKTSSRGGSCKLLKESTNDPNVRKGKCSDVINTDFCKPKAMSH
jgi:hypothetical protein